MLCKADRSALFKMFVVILTLLTWPLTSKKIRKEYCSTLYLGLRADLSAAL